MKKFCVKCGREFDAVGREVICPACKAQAAEDAKRAAVLRAKRASWNGESVPVRISGRASTVIREFSKAHDVPFAEALDEILKATSFFKSTGKAWEDITPYKSRRRDKHATETDDVQDTQEVTSKPQEVTKAAKATNKTVKTAAKAASKATSKASKATSKATSK